MTVPIRRRARELAMQALYQSEVTGQTVEESAFPTVGVADDRNGVLCLVPGGYPGNRDPHNGWFSHKLLGNSV